MLIDDIMSEGVICVNIEDNIVNIAKRMSDANVGLVGVVEFGKLVGVITDRDLITKVIKNKAMDIRDYVSRDIITIEKHESVNDALKKMGDYRVKRLIVTESGNPVGVISISDILSCGFDSLLSDTFSKIYRVDRKE